MIGALLAVNFAAGFLELATIREDSARILEAKFGEILLHLRSVTSVMVLDGYLASSIEEANYAESMRNIVTFRDAKIADSILIYRPSGEIYADASEAGSFGKRDALSNAAEEAAKGTRPVDLVTEKNGAAYLYTLTTARSLNGAVGEFAVGKNLDGFFSGLETQGTFGLKNVELARSANAPRAWYRHSFPGPVEVSFPANWEIRATDPRWNLEIFFIVGRTLLLLVAYAAFFSIWRRYKISQEKLRAEQLLRVSSARLVALGEMCAGISHEINNPLAVIRMSGQQLQASLPEHDLPAEFLAFAEENCERIERTCIRIGSIIKGLRIFARDDTREPMAPASLQQVVKDALELSMARLQYKSVTLRLNLEIQEDTVLCRSVQLSQVVLNLVNNALDAIEATRDPWISIDLFRKNDTFELWVTDSGPGIPPQLQNRIMEPFFTTKPVGQGTGIGLSIASGIMQSHGGLLKIDQTCPNTRFVMTLPSYQSSAANAPKRESLARVH
ncbi:MAG: sensor histidine kinase [Bdellovibrionota bacterium]